MLVEDNGPIHTSKRSLAALAARAHWLTVEWLPKYAPELNDIEPVWHDLKAYHLAPAAKSVGKPDAGNRHVRRTEFRPFSRILRLKSPASLCPQNSVSRPTRWRGRSGG